MPKFGTSVVQSVDIRYIVISEDRSADLGNPDTHKSTTAQQYMDTTKKGQYIKNSFTFTQGFPPPSPF